VRRALILVMDSFGIGASRDAADFGDQGADTFGHIARCCAAGEADRVGVRQGPLQIPNLMRLGLGRAARASTGGSLAHGLEDQDPNGAWGYAVERSRGKDTPSGHWEIAGQPVMFDWGYFPRTPPAMPDELRSELIERCHLPGVLGDCHASGTEILEALGEEHIRTGKPILYTSADSVLQIAAHEQHFGLERLLNLCAVARELVDRYNIGRVIARPFLGERQGEFKRTGNRKDLSTSPPSPTLLDRIHEYDGTVLAVGKIGDIFTHRGITRTIKAEGNDALFDVTLDCLSDARTQTLVFSNFVDFDMLYGHRRDVVGYAAALESFDHRVPELEATMLPGDLAIITADHGCDPTWLGTDHTREHVPVLAFGPSVKAADLGERDSFADIGQTVANHLGVPPLEHGHSFLDSLE